MSKHQLIHNTNHSEHSNLKTLTTGSIALWITIVYKGSLIFCINQHFSTKYEWHIFTVLPYSICYVTDINQKRCNILQCFKTHQMTQQ